MHQRNIIHCDLKSGNILINFDRNNASNKEAGCLPIAFKIADLGIAKDLNEEKISELSMNNGTPRYMAPE